MTIVPVQGKNSPTGADPVGGHGVRVPRLSGVPIDMAMRLVADGIEVQTPEGTFARFILNWPTHPAEYEEFRRIALHLAWLNAAAPLRRRLSFLATTQARLSTPTATEVQRAFEKDFPLAAGRTGWRLRVGAPLDGAGHVITNYDPRTLSDARALNTRAGANPGNFVFVDIRPVIPVAICRYSAL